MTSFVILPLIFLTYSLEQVHATFYFELLTSNSADSRGASFRINRSYGEKRFTFELYTCDTDDKVPGTNEVRAKCKKVENPAQKEVIYAVVNFYDVTDLEFIPGDSMRVDGYNMVDLSDIITVGYDPKAYDRPIFMPISNNEKLAEEKAYKHLARFVVNQRDRPFVNKLLRFCAVNNVAFFFFYTDTNMELFGVYESVMEEMIAESGYKKGKEFWQVLSSKVSSGTKTLKKTVSGSLAKTLSKAGSSSWHESEEGHKRLKNFLTHAQHQTLGASVCRFMSWTLAQRLPPEQKLDLPPEEEEDEEPDHEEEDEDEDQSSSRGRSPSQSLHRSGSLSPSAKKSASLAETDSMRRARVEEERQATYKKWSASLKTRALPPIQPRGSSLLQPQSLENELEPVDEADVRFSQEEVLGKSWSQLLANEPFDKKDPYRENELLEKCTKPVPSLQPRATSTPPTLERSRSLSRSQPLAKKQKNPLFSLRHDIMKSAGYVAFKMFDPCYILKATDEERQRAENICSLNCRMFGMAQQVYGVTFNPLCKHLNGGQCQENLCVCLPRCSFETKTVGMIFCANALRLHTFEQVVKYKIRPNRV